MNRLRILCLHGYHGSAAVLREQMSSLTRGLDLPADFVYCDAPTLATGDFGWWHAVRENASSPGYPGVGSAVAQYRGWSRTLDWVLAAFEREGPFDGVFGFSQGAALTALLVGLRSPDEMLAGRKPLAFDFAILVGAFRASDPALARLYEAAANYAIPSAHIIGRSDFIVPPDNSRAVARLFQRPLILEHAGGHVIPGTSEIREQVSSFLSACGGAA
jgi:pimeloyl-ACP methyl ester carboxylesterase